MKFQSTKDYGKILHAYPEGKINRSTYKGKVTECLQKKKKPKTTKTGNRVMPSKFLRKKKIPTSNSLCSQTISNKDTTDTFLNI